VSTGIVIPILTLLGAPFMLINLECQIVPLENVRVPRVVNTFLVFYGGRNFITLLTRAHHWSLSMSQMNPLYCVPSYLFKIRLDIVFPFLQAVPSVRLPSQNPTYIYIVPRTFLIHLILSDCITEYLVRSANRDAPDNNVSFNFLLLFPS